MEPPSPALIAALRDLRLAAPRDLKRAAGRCRSITRDLPTFDCVWIDALLALRRLTPFQAERLQDGDASGLRVGSFVLVDRLGRGPAATTYLARPIAGGAPVVLKRITAGDHGAAGAREQLDALVAAGRSLRSPHVVVSDQVLDTADGPVAVSRFVPGQDASVRLVRHGRFSGDAVAEIAGQLLGGLAEAHRAGVLHGDLRIINLRLTRAGDAVLVGHGVAAAVRPTLVIDDAAAPERYDGVAPELIGTGAQATAASETYALGCLLWHLLAGRPPFAVGDPLAKLTAHRTRRVPDVRDFAPDAPDELTRLIAEMTDPDPARRPADLEESRRRLRGGARSRRAFLRETATGPLRDRFPWSTAAAALLAVSGLCVALLDHGGAATLLRTKLGGAATSLGREAEADANEVSALPPPDSSGTIMLEHAGPYAPSDVAFRGPLVLRGRTERPATILVTDRPLHLWAESVLMENIRVRHSPSPALLSGPPALVLIESQNLTIRSCRFDCPESSIERRAGAPTAVAWRLLDRADPTSGRVDIRDSVFRGSRESLFAADRLRRLTAENVLAVGQRSLLSMGTAERDAEIALKNLTVRDASSVIFCRAPGGPRRLDVAAEDCVLDLAERGGLLFPWEAATGLRWSGAGVFTSQDVSIVTNASAKTADVSGTDATDGRIEGVVRAEIAFAGPASGSDAASVARISGAPRLAGRSPGIDLSKLPRASGTARPR